MSAGPKFDALFLEQLHELFKWRRDVRRFSSTALPQGMVEELLSVASLAPSVGLSEPWRFVIVDEPERRKKMRRTFLEANEKALGGYSGSRAEQYAALKLEGFEAPAQVAVFCDRQSNQGQGLGRMTMPETAEYSVVAAIQMIWMVARARGLGLGWVSILDPGQVVEALQIPGHWKLVAYLCIGYPQEEFSGPELERVGWESRKNLKDFTLQR